MCLYTKNCHGQGFQALATRRSGGIQGGLANGETIVVKLAFKPTSTISRKQKTVRTGD